MSIIEYSGGAVHLTRAMAKRFVEKMNGMIAEGKMEIGEDQELYNAMCAIACGYTETKNVEQSFGIEEILQPGSPEEQSMDFMREAGWTAQEMQAAQRMPTQGISADQTADGQLAMLGKPTGLGDPRAFDGGLDVFFNPLLAP